VPYRGGVKLDLFFKGMQNKETTASAWLATLLRDDLPFRGAFFAHLDLERPLDPGAAWEVGIETPLGPGFCDVTLGSKATYVLLENKVSASAVTPGQFLAYHRAVLANPDLAARRVVGVYLAPRRDEARAELASVEADPAVAARRRDTGAETRALSWLDDMPAVVEAAARPGEWFTAAGLEAILDHIGRLRRGRPFAQQRQDLVRLLRNVADEISKSRAAGDAAFMQWGSRGEAALYTPRQAITTWLTLRYPETEEYEVGEFVTGDVATVRAALVLNPSTKVGLRDPALMARWRTLLAQGVVGVPGLGGVPARDDTALELAVRFSGPMAELEDLLVLWGTSALTFVDRFVRGT